MATTDTQSEQVFAEVDAFNRVSPLFLLGACVGLAIAVAGFAAGAFYVILAGSCVTLVATLLWVASGMPALVRTVRDWSTTRRAVRERHGSAR